MLKAEIYGKLSKTKGESFHERIEDVLTSNVFATLLYADAWDLLHRWLGSAVNRKEGLLKVRFPAGDPIRLHFWPEMSSADGVGRWHSVEEAGSTGFTFGYDLYRLPLDQVETVEHIGERVRDRLLKRYNEFQ